MPDLTDGLALRNRLLAAEVEQLRVAVLARNDLARECADLRDELDDARTVLAAVRAGAAEESAAREAAEVRAERGDAALEALTVLLASWDADVARSASYFGDAETTTRRHATEVRRAAGLP